MVDVPVAVEEPPIAVDLAILPLTDIDVLLVLEHEVLADECAQRAVLDTQRQIEVHILIEQLLHERVFDLNLLFVQFCLLLLRRIQQLLGTNFLLLDFVQFVRLLLLVVLFVLVKLACVLAPLLTALEQIVPFVKGNVLIRQRAAHLLNNDLLLRLQDIAEFIVVINLKFYLVHWQLVLLLQSLASVTHLV